MNWRILNEQEWENRGVVLVNLRELRMQGQDTETDPRLSYMGIPSSNMQYQRSSWEGDGGGGGC